MSAPAGAAGPVVRLAGHPDDDRTLLGGKAWGIQRMRSLGVPVPPAFAVTTDVCARYKAEGAKLPQDVADLLGDAMAYLESETGRTFGGGQAPLLVSVRSGAAISMPGMMDTILNLGESDEVQAALAAQTGDAAFAADTRRRFAEQFQDVVGSEAPEDPWEQLVAAIGAVFRSWDSRRAIAYRRERGLSDDAGTAVTVQAMVFGNLDDRSGTGVLFTRDPSTGAPEALGEWLPRGQGEDVVSGSHDPLALSALAEQQPDVYRELMDIATRIEQDGRDAQDLEFTVEAGRLWLLQSRSAKRTPQAAVRIAVALAREGLISESEALDRVSPEQAAAALRPTIDPRARSGATVLATGKPACPGVASGTIVTDTPEAEERADDEDIVLARPTTDPEDVPAMFAVNAILTELGGATSHAAVVSREIGVPCIVGCGEGTLMGLTGRTVTVDSEAGEVLEGALAIQAGVDSAGSDYGQLTEWARAAAGTAHPESGAGELADL
ncbi:MAG TPA: pyruvate, phosphate dikinase, partial [Solirubrobacteraceae bacterium]|nr:pyruvate, phosphate dikinase [Solirubrobacteraceae bacterium]